jgi:hypothetical protein
MATPLYPKAWLLTPSGQYVLSPSGERLQVVTDPAQAHDRVRITLVELEVDRCSLTFGVGACTATGEACYNTLNTCKLRSAYTRSTSVVQFVSRGQRAPAGLAWRPYVTGISVAATEIKPAGGLAVRSQSSVTLVDEPDSDVTLDPYRSTRTTPASGTFWGRFIARNARTLPNRTARIRRGWWGEPFTDGWFVDQRFVIDSVRGPDARGAVTLTLSDPVKLLDKAQLPAPSAGKLAADLPAITFSGTLVSATSDKAVLPPGFVPLPNVYLDHELHITGNTGAGQRRAVSAWNSATGELTVTPAWEVIPGSNSTFALYPLTATLQSGQGAAYAGATHVRVGAEIIELASITGDVLRWTSGTQRGAYGSEVESHSASDSVQRCIAWDNELPDAVILELMEAAGIDAALIDTANLETLRAIWLRTNANITACLSAPAKASDLVNELLAHLGFTAWWNPVAELVQFAVNAPASIGTVPAYSDTQFIDSAVERLEADRITQAALFYGLRNAARDASEPSAYALGEVRVDLDAQSTDEYGDERPEVRYSRWLTGPNALHVSSLLARALASRRDAPVRISATLDPRTAVELGGLADVTTRRLQDETGAPATVRCRVIKRTEQDAQVEVVFQSVSALGAGARRYAFIAPNGQPNYPSATESQRQYAYIVGATGQFSDGTEPYRII